MEEPHGAAIGAALAARGAKGAIGAVRARLADEDEALETRLAAARAVGVLCDLASVDKLTDLAGEGAAATATPEALSLSLAALEGLSATRPDDLAKRLAPLLDSGVKAPVRAAAERALASPGRCAK